MPVPGGNRFYPEGAVPKLIFLMEAETGFKVYKGLQKPLVFKNLKGKYIGWAAAAVVLSFILCIIIGNVFDVVYGLIALIAFSVLGVGLVLFKQSKGLHDRDPKTGIYIVRRIVRGNLNL